MNKLLLIDDDQDVLYSIRRNIASPEIELTTASSGEEALQLIPKLKPDLVLMDIRMGGITGLETLRRIRQMDLKLLVILMTAYGTTQTTIEAMKLGAFDYLTKPLEPAKLKEIIAGAFKGEAARLFVKSCLLMGYADGKYGSGEKALVGAYAAALGVSDGDLEELEQSVREFLLSQVAHLANTGVVVEVAKRLGV